MIKRTSGGLPKWIWVAIGVLCVGHASAQGGGNFGVWLGFQYRLPLNKNLILQADLQLRFRNSSYVYDYTLVRTGLQYQLKKEQSIAGGLLYGRNNVQGKANTIWKNEFRLWQQYRKEFLFPKKWTLGLQGRIEERWFEHQAVSDTGERVFSLRFRARVDIRKELGTHWRLVGGNELMYQHTANKTQFNQYRIWLGPAYTLKKVEWQLALMQIVLNTHDQTVLRLTMIF